MNNCVATLRTSSSDSRIAKKKALLLFDGESGLSAYVDFSDLVHLLATEKISWKISSFEMLHGLGQALHLKYKGMRAHVIRHSTCSMNRLASKVAMWKYLITHSM